MRNVNVLVDYDNVKKIDENNATDVSVNLAIMLNAISLSLKSAIPDVEEIACRLYGGWTTVSDQRTDRHLWMMSNLSKFRGRHNRVRTRISIATALVLKPEADLIGTYRDKKQKMVDAMIASDLISLSMDDSCSLALVSDDDDLVPSTISGSTFRGNSHPLFVLRRSKKLGEGFNDHIITSCNVRFCSY